MKDHGLAGFEEELFLFFMNLDNDFEPLRDTTVAQQKVSNRQFMLGNQKMKRMI